MKINIIVNGEPARYAAETTLSGLLLALELQGRRIAVEVNHEIVPRSQHPLYRLAEGDRVEIVHAIGGG